MNQVTALVLVSVVVLLVAVVLVAILARVMSKRPDVEEKETDYQAFFSLGLVFFPIGLTLTVLSYTSDFPAGVGIPFLAMGAIYIALGLSKRNKRKKET